MLATHVNVLSPKEPNRQFLPDRAFGIVFGELVVASALRRDLDGDPGLISGILQTFTCRTPTLSLN